MTLPAGQRHPGDVSIRRQRLHAGDAPVLNHQVILYPVLGTLTPQARLFDAAKWRDFARQDAGVDADHAVFELLGHAEDAADVAAVEVRCQAKFGIVGHRDHFIVGLEAEQRRDRAEGFFARDQHVLADVGEDGRLEEGAAQNMAFAAHQYACAFVGGVGYL